ncbi:MAG: ribonuclease HI [Acidobacteriota bacterium]|nr:ribonuclease HI [Acidobacteriota bacterium]
MYTDGGADPNPGYGGWGVVLLHPESGRSRELSGGAPDTTNNRMELTAAIEGLGALKAGCDVDLYTDSTYLKRGVEDWMPGWKTKAWKRRDGSSVKNADLWRTLDAATRRHTIRWHWVKGHAGDKHNERADVLATEEIRRQRDRAAEAAPCRPARDHEVVLKLTCNKVRGAWIALVRSAGGEEDMLSGNARGVTTNQLELQATLEILEQLPSERSLSVVGGSDYLRQGASQWLAGWKRSGWRTRDGNPVKNAELWRSLDACLRGRKVDFRAPGVEEREEIKALGKRLKESLEGES